MRLKYVNFQQKNPEKYNDCNFNNLSTAVDFFVLLSNWKFTINRLTVPENYEFGLSVVHHD